MIFKVEYQIFDPLESIGLAGDKTFRLIKIGEQGSYPWGTNTGVIETHLKRLDHVLTGRSSSDVFHCEARTGKIAVKWYRRRSKVSIHRRRVASPNHNSLCLLISSKHVGDLLDKCKAKLRLDMYPSGRPVYVWYLYKGPAFLLSDYSTSSTSPVLPELLV